LSTEFFISWVQRFRVQRFRVQRFRVLGSGLRGSAVDVNSEPVEAYASMKT
jgi:hypothetical protein